MFTVDPNVRHLIPAAAKPEDARQGLDCVRVAYKNGEFTAEASDGKILVRVSGESDSEPADAMAQQVLLPAETLAKVSASFRDRFGDERSRGHRLTVLPTAEGGATVEDNWGCRSTHDVAPRREKFPATDAVIPKTPPALTVRLNLSLLRKLARIAAKFVDGFKHEVRVNLYPDRNLLVMTNPAGSELSFTGVLMLISSEDPRPKPETCPVWDPNA